MDRDRGLALGLAALLFSVYLLTFSGAYHSSDEMSMLVATDSLARRGAWDIDLIRWMGEQQGSFGPDGHLYSRKGIGTTLAALPLYWLAVQSTRLGNVQAAMLTNAVATALTGALLYLTVRRLGYRQGVALGTCLAYGLATMAWPYARTLFSETLAALGLTLCLYGLVGGGRPSRSGRALPLLAGAGLGVAILARLNNAIAAPFLGLLLLLHLRRSGRPWRAWGGPVVAFALPVLGALAVTAWYNWIRFGDPLTTGYLPEERFATPFFVGLYGLTFSPGKGLFWYNPLLFASLIAWPAFVRRHRAEALTAAAVALSTVAFYAPWYLWWAGHGWGPRFLVSILPLAALPLAESIEGARHRALAAGLGALAAASGAVQLLGVAVNFNLYLEEVYARLGLYAPVTLFDPAYSPLLRQWAYLRPGNLDLAWARGGTTNRAALGGGLLLVALSAGAVAAARKGRLTAWAQVGLIGALAAGSLGSLLLYAPSGDVAQAARALAAMERPGEAVAVTDPLLTAAFQDAYDGRLAAWGGTSWQEVLDDAQTVWALGPASAAPAAGRFQVGRLRLDLHLPPGRTFDERRLSLPPGRPWLRLGDVAEVIVVRQARSAVHPGGKVPLTVYWRALAPTAVSYTLFVQALGPQDTKAGQIDRLPCDGSCPTPTWRPGDLIGEWLELPIRPEAMPGSYELVLGMYDLATGQRLPAVDARGATVGTFVALGSVEVEP